MSIETTDTLVVGGGQAGLAMSEHLSKNEIPHIVLESHRIAERWRTGRWDSLVANGPAWHDRFPGMTFPNIDGDDFATKEEVAAYFEAYSQQIDAPIRCGVRVESVEANIGRSGFRVQTSSGVIEAKNVVAATGPFQTPVIPKVVPDLQGLTQIHSCDYRNPEQMPQGAVLVVGAGSSGTQIAEELMRSGKKVYLSVGPHDRPPRSYRGHDFVWWLGVLGKWDAPASDPNSEHVTIAVSGARGGNTVDFRHLSSQGMTLVGLTEGFNNGKLSFKQDLADNVRRGDENYLSLLDEADAYIARNGIDLPLEPDARLIAPDPDCISNPILEMDLNEAGITSIIWATGYSSDYSWLKVDAVDENGRPKHQRGISSEPGIYFIGLPLQTGRGSSFIWGVWYDAKFLADHIDIQRKYLDHHTSTQDKKIATH